MRPISVLIVFSDTGGGHRAAASAIATSLRRLDPTVNVSAVDPLIGEGQPVVRSLARLYPTIIQRARPAWGAIYHASNTRPAFASIRATFGGQVRRVLEAKLAETDPDLVLSVHPLVNHFSRQAIRRSGRRRGLMTVVTDLVDIHRGWAYPGADRIIVPTEAARELMLEMEVAPNRVEVLGLPIGSRFRPRRGGEERLIRVRLGLDPDRGTVLISGGGEGSGRMLEQVRALAGPRRDWQVIAVCGRNEELRARLARARLATKTLVLGFVDNMPELMRAADVYVTKAGPGAIAEALATRLPLIVTGYLAGQETANVGFVTGSGIGWYEPKPRRLPGAVGRLLADDHAEAKAMARRADRLSRPHATADIAREALRLAAVYRAASQARR